MSDTPRPMTDYLIIIGDEAIHLRDCPSRYYAAEMAMCEANQDTLPKLPYVAKGREFPAGTGFYNALEMYAAIGDSFQVLIIESPKDGYVASDFCPIEGEKPCEHRIKVYVTGGVWCSECGAFRRATSKVSDRNIKLNDHCDQCPFHRTAHGDFWCCFDKDARRIGGTDFTPHWCPIIMKSSPKEVYLMAYAHAYRLLLSSRRQTMSDEEEKPCEHRIKVYVTGGVWCSECGAFRRATRKGDKSENWRQPSKGPSNG